MTTPNPTPTRADVLREYSERFPWNFAQFADALADEIVRLRAEREAMIRRVEALERYDAEAEYDEVVMAQHLDGCWLKRSAVLAALRDGGTDGR